MNFKSDFFRVDRFNSYNVNHLEALKKITNDKGINKYFTNLDFAFYEVTQNYRLQGNYLVYLKNVNIGFIRLIEGDNYLELQYGILEEFRNKKLSILLLNSIIAQLSKYNVDKLVLYIKDDNIPSIKTANKIGFEVEKENIDEKIYIKKLR